jgi:hypothetical protein
MIGFAMPAFFFGWKMLLAVFTDFFTLVAVMAIFAAPAAVYNAVPKPSWHLRSLMFSLSHLALRQKQIYFLGELSTFWISAASVTSRTP